MERICRSGILFAGNLLRGALQATFKPRYIKRTLPFFVTMSLVVSTMLPGGFGMITPVAQAATATMSPTSVASSDEWDVHPEDSNKVTAVQIDDVDTSYISSGKNNDRQTFNFPGAEIPAGATINSVTVYTVDKKTGEGERKFAIIAQKEPLQHKKGSQVEKIGEDISAATEYALHGREMTSNPFGGEWTVEEVNNWTMSFGVERVNGGHDDDDRDAFGQGHQNPKEVRVTQIYLKVDYTAQVVTHTLTYTAGANGAISGDSPQTVVDGEDGTEVTAVPDSGFHFVDWSDASTTNPRTDADVTADISVTANFAADEVRTATIKASKIVCDDEKYLPNWGEGGHGPITASTATAFVEANRPHCDFVEGWKFEWAPEGTSNPGNDITGEAGGAWKPSDATGVDGTTTITITAEDLADSNYLWFREVLQTGYVPFSGWLSDGSNKPSKDNEYSAEIYATTDALNYDNYERIEGGPNGQRLQLGQTYYAVAFNVLKPVVCDPTKELITNGSFESPVVENPALWDIFPGSIPGWSATWIFPDGAPEVANIELQRNPLNGWSAQDGQQQWAELDTDYHHPGEGSGSDASSIKLTQTLTTTPGQKYQVSFYTSPRPGYGTADNSTAIWWNGELQDTIVEDGTSNSNVDWKLHTYSFMANDTVTELSFVDVGTANSFGPFLDNVSVKADCGQEPPRPHTYAISGYKFNDLDHDGKWDTDSDETGLSGWIIFIDDDNDGIRDEDERATETNADGYYSFSDLKEGPYIIAEVMKVGWMQTTPGGVDQHHYEVKVKGENVDHRDFGNYQNNCDFGTQTGWYGKYYDYAGSGDAKHPDMNLDPSLWPDKTHGDPLGIGWNTDWYASKYLVQSQVDANLNFGDNFFPLDSLGADDPTGASSHNYHFGVRWSGEVNITTPDTYEYTITADDDAWVYVDGVLVTDNSGIHPATAMDGSVELTAGEHVFDIFFAERHTVASYMDFTFKKQLTVMPFSYNCEVPEQPEEPVTGTVTGMKFNDADGDGTKDENEVGIKDWTIYASKFLKSLSVDSHNDDPIEDLDSPTTANDGASVSLDVEAGKQYILRASGTFDAGDSITADAQYSIRTGTEWTDEVENYAGYGTALLDLWINGNSTPVHSGLWGSYNANHIYWYTYNAVSNEQVTFHIHDIFAQNNDRSLTVDAYEVVATAKTDEFGNYELSIPAEITGDVIVAEQTQFGWTQTYPMTLGYHTAPADGLTKGLNFGNHDVTIPEPKGSITGSKWSDHNGNHEKDANDETLSGWVIYLDANDNGVLDSGEQSVTTVDGNYTFPNLPAGTYVVREEGKSGWSQTHPMAPTGGPAAYRLIVGAGENGQWDWSDIDFGNKQDEVDRQGETGGSTGGGGGGGYYTPPVTNNEQVGGEQQTNQEVALADPTNEAVGGEQLPAAGTPTFIVMSLAALTSLLATSFTYRKKKSQFEE